MATCASVIWSRPAVKTPKGKRFVPRWNMAAAGETTGPCCPLDAESSTCSRLWPFAAGKAAAGGAGRLRLPVPLSDPPHPATSATAIRVAAAAVVFLDTGGIVDRAPIGWRSGLASPKGGDLGGEGGPDHWRFERNRARDRPRARRGRLPPDGLLTAAGDARDGGGGSALRRARGRRCAGQHGRRG